MRHICDRTEIVDSREIGNDTFEVCATELAAYDDATSEMLVTLDSFVRQVNPLGADRTMRPAWLPHRDTIRHQMSREEGIEASREMFRRWVGKVRGSLPDREVFAGSVNASRV